MRNLRQLARGGRLNASTDTSERADREDASQRPGARVLAALGLWRSSASPAETRWLLAAVVVAVVSWLTAFLFMSSVRLSGDETFYMAGGRAIADAMTGGRPPATAVREVVAAGWFMPGMSMLLAPFHLLGLDVGHVAAVRAYAVVIMFLLWLWTLRECRLAFGRPGAIAVLVFPTLAAAWLLFSATLWGDVPAGLVVAIVCARTYRVAVRVAEAASAPLREVVLLELLMVAMVYLRSSTIMLVVGVHALLVGIAVTTGRPGRLRAAGAFLAGLSLFAVLLAPWSVTASRVLEGTVVTTTSAPLSLALTFGEPDELCFGPCPGSSPWHGPLQFARRLAQERGVSVLVVQREMAEHALRGLTFAEYTEQVAANFRRFANPAGPGPRGGVGFVDRFVLLSSHDPSPDARAVLSTLLEGLTLAVYIPFFLALVVANGVVVVRLRRLQILSLCVKVFTACLFVQPFLHQSHSRYWVGYAPLMAIAAAFLLRWWRTPTPHVTGSEARTGRSILHGLDSSGRILTGLQAMYVLAVVAIALTLSIA